MSVTCCVVWSGLGWPYEHYMKREDALPFLSFPPRPPSGVPANQRNPHTKANPRSGIGLPSRAMTRRVGRRGGGLPPDNPTSDLRWVMLDCFAHCTLLGPREETVGDGTLSEISRTCTGKPIAVSLKVAPPPAVSRLYIYYKDGLRPEMKELDPPSVIAAHGRSILFQICVPFIDQCCPGYYPIDYFVYTASGSPDKRPYLRRLPPCFRGRQVDPELDNLFHPYRYQQQRPMSSNEIGLLCHGDEEFTVAKLSPWGEICMLHYAPDKAMEWDIRSLQMPRGEGIPSLLQMSRSWNTDVVIPFGDSLCWVDCYLGLLFVRVHGDLTTRFVALPADLDPHRLYIDPGSPDPARRVCVTEGGIIKLIAISDLAGRSLDIYSSNFKIRTWKLINGVKWKEDATMGDCDLKDVLASDKRLALLPLPPEFPTINLVDHDIVCFVLNNRKRICWLVEVNLKKKALGVVTLYINEEKEDQAAAAEELATFYDIVRKKPPPIPFVHANFIPSQFTKYLTKHAIKSHDFSKMLEKAEVRRGIKNGWINHGQARVILEIC